MKKSPDRWLQLLGLATKAGKTVSGEWAVEQAIRKQQVYLTIVAMDASDNTKKHFSDMCAYRQIPVRFAGTKEMLGKCMGKHERASVGVLDQGFADTLLREV